MGDRPATRVRRPIRRIIAAAPRHGDPVAPRDAAGERVPSSEQPVPPVKAGPGTAVDSAARPGPAVTTADYRSRASSARCQPESGRVMIRHEEIPGFMKAMTMPFRPADESILGCSTPATRSRASCTSRSRTGPSATTNFEISKVTKPAAPRAMTLDISKEKAQLREKPRILTVGEEVPDFAMTGQDGKAFKLSDLRGKVVVLTFIYTRCPMPDFCPLMDRKFSELAQRLGAFPKRAKDIRLISLSFDPENDTPEVLRKHAAIRGAIAPAVGLCGRLARRAGPDRTATGAVLRAGRQGDRPQPLHGDHRPGRANWPAWRWARSPTAGRRPTSSGRSTACCRAARSERM